MIEDEIIGRLEARNAELEQMVAVLMRHEARDDTIKVQRARIAELTAALKEIAERHIPDQPSACGLDEIDYVRKHYAELRRAARDALEKKND